MYWTDMMQRILKSEMGQKIVNEVAPVYGEAYVALWLFEVIGRALDDMEFWTEEYRQQIVPQTATWSLSLWEIRYGLPVDETLSVEQRRKKIITRKSTGHTPMNAVRLAEIISAAAGVNVRIEEFTGQNQFTVWINGVPSNIDETYVRSVIDKTKQAHMIYDLKYEISAGDGRIYTAGVIQSYKEVHMIHTSPQDSVPVGRIYAAGAIQSYKEVNMTQL